MLIAVKPRIYADATSLVVFVGPPNVTVKWTLVSGPGDLTALATRTDDTGRAAARWKPNGLTGTAVVRCEYGT